MQLLTPITHQSHTPSPLRTLPSLPPPPELLPVDEGLDAVPPKAPVPNDSGVVVGAAPKAGVAPLEACVTGLAPLPKTNPLDEAPTAAPPQAGEPAGESGLAPKVKVFLLGEVVVGVAAALPNAKTVEDGEGLPLELTPPAAASPVVLTTGEEPKENVVPG